MTFKNIALYFIISTLVIHKGNAQSQPEADTYYKTGLTFKNRQVYDSALFFYSLALEEYLKLNNQEGVAGALNRIGIVHFRLKDYDKAMDYQNQSFAINDSLKYRVGLMKNMLNIGNILNEKQEYEEAKKHYIQAIEMGGDLDQDGLMATTLNNLGALLISHSGDNPILDLDSALYYFQQAFDIYSKHNLNDAIAGSLQNFGLVYEEKQEYDSALYYYRLAFEQTSSSFAEATLMENIGNAYKKQGDYQKAKDAYQQGLDIAFKNESENRDKNRIQTLSKNLAELYIADGDNDRAVPLLLQHIVYKDSAYNIAKERATADFKTIYQTERTKTALEKSRTAAANLRIKQNNLRAAFIITSLIALVVIGFFIQRSRLNRIEAKTLSLAHSQEVNRLIQQQDLKTFDAMIEGQEKERKRVAEELHDRLGSILTAAKLHLEAGVIGGLKQEQLEFISNLLTTAIDDTREISHNMLSGVLTKFGLVAALNNLKETVADGGQLSVHLKTQRFDERLDTDKEVHLYRIVQELLSNTLRHAEASKFDIDLTRNGQVLNLTVADNGKGGANTNAGNGIGFRNIQSRVTKIGGEWTLSSPVEQGTTATITLKI